MQLEEHTPLTLGAGEEATLLRLRLRAPPPAAFALDAALTVHTNLSRYSLPLRIYSGKLIFVSRHYRHVRRPQQQHTHTRTT